MRGALLVGSMLLLLASASASDFAMAQSVVVGPGGVRVYEDREPPPPPPPPGYGRSDYGPPPPPPGYRRGDYGPPPPPPGYGRGDYDRPRGYGPPPRSGGQVCANENGFCDFSGYATVRYGARGVYVARQARDGIPCNNRVFGDPTPGIPKRCIID